MSEFKTGQVLLCVNDDDAAGFNHPTGFLRRGELYVVLPRRRLPVGYVRLRRVTGESCDVGWADRRFVPATPHELALMKLQAAAEAS